MNSHGIPILKIRNLSVSFETTDGLSPVLNGIDLDLGRRETLGIAGPSGSGKTSLAMAILGLLPSMARITRGEVLFDGEDLLKLSPKRLQELRGLRISMVFQEPAVALNPVMRIGSQVAEGMVYRLGFSRSVALRRAGKLLEEVGIADVGRCLQAYPHELSGGMQQRVLLASAISCDPELLICDEPTSSLDPGIRWQVLDLLLRIKAERQLSILLISHDLYSLRALAERAVRINNGRVDPFELKSVGTDLNP